MNDAKRQRSALVQNQSEGKITIDLFLALGILGSSFFFAWMLLVFGTTLFTNKIASGDQLSLVAHGVLALAVVLSLFFVWRFSELVFRLRPVLPLFAVLLSTANLLAELFPFVDPESPVLLVAWALTGIGFALLVVQWSEFNSLLNIGQSKVFISSSMFIGMIWVLGFLVTNPQYQGILVFLLPLFSLAAFIFLKRYYRPFLEIELIDRKTSNARTHLSWKPVLSTVISSIALGFILAWFIKYGHGIPYMDFLLVFALLLIMLFMIVDSVHWKKFGENFVMRSFLLFAAIGMLPLLFLGDEGKAVCCVIMFCGLLVIVVQGNSAITEHINLFHLAPMQTVAFGRMFSYLGICIGTASGYIAFWTTVLGEATLAVVTVTLILIFVIEAVFVMMENNYPIDEEAITQSSIYMVSRPLDSGAPGNKRAEADIDDPLRDRQGIWRRKCEAAAVAYGLSSRQKEVLFLLAKGRNAEYITNELVISLHTAKAHIYNIYQKMNVHSRQELINLVEKVQIDS
ncbi:MAG: LuxR C-terminal-related transcriptional regulator [Coriobacteriales bacterium]|jgi:DNA-binding CsgD family transcriptional regulator|nr:LuxR C-terminal-related transcriptional regulator [Coriobacteriales bacterium]